MLPRIALLLVCLLLATLPAESRAQQAMPQLGAEASQGASGRTFRSDLEAYSLLPQERDAAIRKRRQQTLALIALAGGAATAAAIGASSASVPIAVAASVFIVYLSMP